jgi:RNA recognition motif-containing protein
VNIYVGKLSTAITKEESKKVFQAFGQVTSTRVIKGRYSGYPRRFGFVEMPKADEAQAAISGLNGKEIKGRIITVAEARITPRRRGSSNQSSQ